MKILQVVHGFPPRQKTQNEMKEQQRRMHQFLAAEIYFTHSSGILPRPILVLLKNFTANTASPVKIVGYGN